jgi:hypothetical protein
MGWVGENSVIGFGMEGAADKKGMAFDGEENDGVESGEEVGNTSHS